MINSYQKDRIEYLGVKGRLIDASMAANVLPGTVHHVGDRQFGNGHSCCWLGQLGQSRADITVFYRRQTHPRVSVQLLRPGSAQMPRSPSKLRTFPECSMVTQQVKPGTWPLPSSSAYPLPGISSVDSVLQQSLKSSVTASPTGNTNSYWPDIFLFKLFMKHTLQHSEAGQHLCNIF